MGQNEGSPRVDWEDIFVSPVNGNLVLFGVCEVGVYGFQVFFARSLPPSQGKAGCRLVGIVVRTEACDDKQRTDDLEGYLTTKRELTSIVADRRGEFLFGGVGKVKN